MLTQLNQGKITIKRLVEVMCEKPAAICDLKHKGKIEDGYDADVIVIDQNARYTLRHEDMWTKCSWTPFAGVEVTGKTVMTIVNGQIVYRDDVIVGTPNGMNIWEL
jgi:dihydroorotase